MSDEETLQRAIHQAGLQSEWGAAASLTSYKRYYALIFSHDFAKAFWPSRPCNHPDDCNLGSEYNWQYHLQQMVLHENPLEYLARFLDKEDNA